MLAVINTKGYQYVVKKGDRIVIPAIVGDPGKTVEFDRVMMLKDDGDVIVGKPFIDGVRVKGVVKDKGRLPKVIVYKFIRRENYRRKKGHRQDFSEVEITEIIKKAKGD